MELLVRGKMLMTLLQDERKQGCHLPKCSLVLTCPKKMEDDLIWAKTPSTSQIHGLQELRCWKGGNRAVRIPWA